MRKQSVSNVCEVSNTRSLWELRNPSTIQNGGQGAQEWAKMMESTFKNQFLLLYYIRSELLNLSKGQ